MQSNPIPRRSLLAAAAGAAWPAPAALAAYERATGGKVGLYAENLATGARITWRADQRFVMCSSFKASLAAFVLSRIDRGQDHPDIQIPFTRADLIGYAPVAEQNLSKGMLSVAAMCAAAVEYSDNACANLLLARVGGPPAMTSFWRSIGDNITRLDHNEPMLNRSPPGDPHDTTTPAATAQNLRRLLLGNVLKPSSRASLTSWMLACQTGFNRLRAGLPRDWKIADKTGNNGADAAIDIAMAWPRPNTPVLICAYTQGGSPTAQELDTVFKEIGRLAGRNLA